MSTPSVIFIPPELVDVIIGNLFSTNDVATLFSYSLVSRAFSSAARRRLFSHLVFGIYKHSHAQRTLGILNLPPRSLEATSSRNKTLASLLADQTSDLPLLVRGLQIRIDKGGSVFNEGWCLEKVLKIIKARALNLNKLSIGSYQAGGHPSTCSWEEIPIQISSLLLSICGTLPVSELRFLYIDKIPSSIVTTSRYSYPRRIETQGSSFSSQKANVAFSENGPHIFSSLAPHLPRHGSYTIFGNIPVSMLIYVNASFRKIRTIAPSKYLMKLISLLNLKRLESLVSFTW